MAQIPNFSFASTHIIVCIPRQCVSELYKFANSVNFHISLFKQINAIHRDITQIPLVYIILMAYKIDITTHYRLTSIQCMLNKNCTEIIAFETGVNKFYNSFVKLCLNRNIINYLMDQITVGLYYYSVLLDLLLQFVITLNTMIVRLSLI